MRRRLNMFESVTDDTTRPHLYLNAYEGTTEPEDPPLALYDEALWAELKEAQARLREIEARIMATAVAEPLDRVESSLGRELWDMLRGPYNRERWDAIEAELVAHAATVERESPV